MTMDDSDSAESLVRTRVGAYTYLAPCGTLTETHLLDALDRAVTACIEAHETQLILDLSQVPAIYGEGLERLLGYRNRLRPLGGWLRLNAPTPLIRDILIITGLDRQLEIFDAQSNTGVGSGFDEASDVIPAASPGRRFGDILMDRKLITQAQMEEAVRLQNQLGLRMGRILVEKGWVNETQMLSALAGQLGVPFVNLRPGLYDPAAAALVPITTARRLEVLPLFRIGNDLTLATTEPQSVPVADEIEQITGCRTRWVMAVQDVIQKILFDAYAEETYLPNLIDSGESDLEIIQNRIPDDYTRIDELAGGSPVVNLVNSLIQRAIHDGASDIHLEMSRNKARVRFRIDSLLYEVMNPRLDLYPALVSRLKVMANLDIAERRLPQDGRIQVATAGRTVDLRFSSLPGIYGEKIVLRILDKAHSILDIDRLGMSKANLVSYKHLLARPHGLILVTGPTGSGKTTTLYAAIDHLKSIEKNIVTIEDPVEYQIDIINQNQVNDAIGLSFAKLLRHVLRQDPDIVMVGEIRDRQTAEIAVQSALTGHLVLSTLHTNDAPSAIARLADMGIEPYLLSSALAGVIAQRLVRKVCPECRARFQAPPEVLTRYGWEEKGRVMLHRGRGCKACYDSGYKGRVAIHEILVNNRTLQRMIVSGASYDELDLHMKSTGSWLFADGMDRVLDGMTTIEEISCIALQD